jgi:hypothetical protein
MPLIQVCAHRGCGVLTMGAYCLEHELPETHPTHVTMRVAAWPHGSELPGLDSNQQPSG